MASATVNHKAPDCLGKSVSGFLMEELFQVALPMLSHDDLKTVASRMDEVEGMLNHLSTLATGIGALVAEDQRNIGNFQDSDGVSTLLFMLGSYSRYAQETMRLAMAADGQILVRKMRQSGAGSDGRHD